MLIYMERPEDDYDDMLKYLTLLEDDYDDMLIHPVRPKVSWPEAAH